MTRCPYCHVFQAEEMKKWGNVDDLPLYSKKAQALDEKLQLGADIIDAFNIEEAAFGWEATIYPARLQILTTMKPFQQLYDMSCDFHTKQKLWLYGPRSDINPDMIEQVSL